MEPEPVIVVAGEALFDLVPDGPGSLRAHPGGGPFNTARTIARLEQPAAYLGRISRDRFGERLRALLADDGVRLDSVVETDDPTTLALPSSIPRVARPTASTSAPRPRRA